MSFHRHAFSVALTAISRVLIVRDRVRGWVGPGILADSAVISVSHHSISSGASCLDAWFVKPAATTPRATVLICHGIAETAEHWLPVQHVLASDGIASLVFDYSGYGKSTGRVDWTQYEHDAISAFHALQRLEPAQPITMLGFSLGSGVASAVIHKVAADRLILCAAFTSFRGAARSIGIPACLTSWVPPIWSAEESLRDCHLPILVVHGEKDRLFPVKMAHNLFAHCGKNAELIVVPNLGHIEPFRKPRLSYWGQLFPR